MADDLGYKGPSYEKLIRLVMKKKWIVNLAKVMMILLQLFKVVGNNIFIVEVMVHIFCNQGFSAQYCKPRSFYVLMSFIISAPTYLILNISFYSYISLGSVISACAMIVALSYQSIYQLTVTSGTLSPQMDHSYKKIFMAFSLIFQGLQGVGLIMPIRASMMSTNQFRPVQKYTTLFVATIYLGVFLLMMAAFGNKIQPIVVLTFSKDYIVIFSLTVLYGLVIFITYPMSLFPIYTAIVNTSICKEYISGGQGEQSRDRRTKLILYSSRVVCLLTIYAIVLIKPNFVPFLGLVGAVFTCTFLFYIPLILYNQHFSHRGRLSTARKYFNILAIGIVMIFSMCSAYDSLINMFRRDKW